MKNLIPISLSILAAIATLLVVSFVAEGALFPLAAYLGLGMASAVHSARLFWEGFKHQRRFKQRLQGLLVPSHEKEHFK